MKGLSNVGRDGEDGVRLAEALIEVAVDPGRELLLADEMRGGLLELLQLVQQSDVVVLAVRSSCSIPLADLLLWGVS